MGWYAIIPSGVITKVHAVSDHRIFQTLKGVLSLSERTDSLPRQKGAPGEPIVQEFGTRTTNLERDASKLSFRKKT
jgi:hypothetical protein